MDPLYISLFESIYLTYMFCFLETSIDFNFSRPFLFPHLSKMSCFEHLTSSEKGLRICPFGRVAIFALIALLIVRHFIHIPKWLIYTALGIALLLSFLNMNALVYLIPVLLIEFFYIKNIHKNNSL